jgi:hypothetical protein
LPLAGSSATLISRLTRDAIIVLTGPAVILVLKVAVAAVTVLLALSLLALALGRPRLHGGINLLFALLTLVAVFGLEVVIRWIDPRIFDSLYEAYPSMRQAMRVHLSFSIPSALLVPIMVLLGTRRRTAAHVAVGLLFLMLWTGTFFTGIFFLPHRLPEVHG